MKYVYKVAAPILFAVLVLTMPMANAESEKISNSNSVDKITRTILERTAIPGTDEEIRLMMVIYPPGHPGRSHLHPVVGLNYIVSGTAESQYEGENLTTYNSGDSYTDPANKKHLVFRNASNEEELRFLVAYRVKKSGVFAIPLD